MFTDVPQIIGPYRIRSVLGRGGMGIVYGAYREDTRSNAALKTVLLPREGMLQSIRREIKALARIRHPGIIRIIDEGMHEGLPWFAMELLHGRTLKEFCHGSFPHQNTLLLDYTQTAEVPAAEQTALVSESDEQLLARQTYDLTEESLDQTEAAGPPPDAPDIVLTDPEKIHPPELLSPKYLKTVLSIIRKLCAALAFLHGEGIVHRDLKPENIFLRPDLFPVIMDFGLILQYGRESREELAVEHLGMGTVIYMAPEQIRGETVDARADLYALGCILFELLTGQPPFTGLTIKEIIDAHLKLDELKLIEGLSWIPAPLQELLKRLMAKNPQQRLGFATDVDLFLAKVENGRGRSQFGPPPKSYLYRSRLVGREKTLNQCQDYLQQMQQGTGQCLLVSGESGVGKTRLGLEIGRRAHRNGIKVITGACQSLSNRPLEPFRLFLQHVADRCQEHGLGETERLLGPRGKILADFESALSHLPGQQDLSEPATLEADAARIRLFSVLAHTMALYADAIPLLLIIDNLQWIDDLSLGFLEFLVRIDFLSQQRILLLVLHRSEESGSRLTHFISKVEPRQKIKLQRLTFNEIKRMVSEMLALTDPPTAFCSFLDRHSEGNPLFITEYINTVVAAQMLHRNQFGHWQFAEMDREDEVEAALDSLPLPGMLHDLIKHRFEQLTQVQQHLVQAAAVLGRDFDFSILMRLTQYTEESLFELIEDPVRVGIFERLQLESLRFRFTHHKFRDIAYAQIPSQKVKSLHRIAAQSIEDISGSEVDFVEVGHHWEKGGDIEQARTFYLQAARLAKSRYDYAQAEQSYRAYLHHSPEQSPETVVVLNEFGHDILHLQGRNGPALEVHDQALKQAQAMNDRLLIAQTSRFLGLVHYYLGHMEQARTLYEQTMTLSDDPMLKGETLGHLATLHFTQGDMEEARFLFEQAFTIHQKTANTEQQGFMQMNIANVYYNTGHMKKAEHLYQSALDICRRSGNLRLEGLAIGNIANTFYSQGKMNEALNHYQEALHIQEKVGDRRLIGVMKANIANIYLNQGLLEQAADFYQKAILLQREVGDRRVEGLTLINLGSIYYKQQRLAETETVFRTALEIFIAVGDKQNEGVARGNLAELAFSRGDVERAYQLCQQALALHKQVGNRSYQAIILINLASHFRRIHASYEEAENLIREALTILHDINNPLDTIIALCEQGYLNLARQSSARIILDKLSALLKKLSTSLSRGILQPIQRLEEAEKAFQEQRFSELFQGELITDLPSGLLHWLRENKLLTTPDPPSDRWTIGESPPGRS
ncbi:tetratricopeptide repeat protein [candidate division CSSED10-310 bacterium]|uniref:Tetratricopeptide repeat protein n=1 Tax=candidate division CSSED10-310 bacterium TaxID=2855610 RepID=A0ABV6Z5J1_UNCC1